MSEGTVDKAAKAPTDAADATTDSVAGDVDAGDTAPAAPIPVSADTQRDLATLINDGFTSVMQRLDALIPGPVDQASDAATESLDKSPVGVPWTHRNINPLRRKP